MIQRIFRTLHQEIRGLHEAAYLLGIFALLAKILALFRDRLLAHNFGASEVLDIYYAAFRIPDFIYISLASLVAGAVLIPFIVERLRREDESARSFFNNIFTVFSFGIIATSIVVFFALPFLKNIVAPGFSSTAQDELVLLSRIMLVSPILLGLSGLFASVTQTLGRFLVYALSPVLYNVGIIVGVIVFYPLWGLSGLAYGVVLGSLFHVLIQIPVLLRQKFMPRFLFPINFSEVKNVMFLSVPRTLTLSAHHIVLLIFISFASLMGEGAISIFNFSFNLQSVPLSIIGVSYSVAAFPTLARMFSNGETSAFTLQVLSSLRHIIFWSFPVLVLFIILRAQIVRTVLGTGEFGWPETRLTAAALALFSVSVIAQSIILLLVRGYYAAGRTMPPLVINVASSVLIIILALFFMHVFASVDFFRYFIESMLRISFVSGTSIVMLPLAFSLGTLINVFVLWYFFKKDFSIGKTALGVTFRHSFYASVFMGFVAYELLGVFDDVFDINTFWGIFSQGLFSGIIGVIAGILLLKLLKNKEISEVSAALHQKFWKQRPIAPDQGGL
ncbi:MAG: murein biosynthesis integral membrane protein MurJ [bacterium]|nr:murein biosynthesis integral membrane protein MurJ [bacterium]